MTLELQMEDELYSQMNIALPKVFIILLTLTWITGSVPVFYLSHHIKHPFTARTIFFSVTVQELLKTHPN